jgi:hypothetical protein
MKIVDSDAFVEMPASTQALYFHLGMRADDDGFVNKPNRIARDVGASGDDLKLLQAKRFILAFENGVIVIKHWKIHNTLRKDRLKSLQYPELAARIYIKGNEGYTDNPSTGDISLLNFRLSVKCLPSDSQMSDKCQTTDGQLTDNCQHKVSKGKISKDNISEVEVEGSDSNEESDLSTDSYDKELSFSHGTLGEGIVFMSDEQFSSLCEKLSLEEIHHYFDRLKDFIRKKPNVTIYSHYKTILKWVEEDRSL